MNEIFDEALIKNKKDVPAFFRIFLKLLASNWTWGELVLIFPNGSSRSLTGKVQGHRAVVNIHNYRFATRVLKSGDIGFAEGYMAGEWDSPDLAALLETLVNNYDHIRRLFDGNMLTKIANLIGHALNRNSRSGSQRNIHAHYDLGNAFYKAWLDPSMTYSSARFSTPGMSLEQGQTAKYASLAALMDLKAEHSVLEIGCGWGGFAEYAAKDFGAKVTGITISHEQYRFASERIQKAGLSERVDIQLVDYRDVEGQFDHVASIEMFEAVGREYWPTYFQKIGEVLKPNGTAGLQIITIDDDLVEGYNERTDFIQKYIFPGGVLPSEAQLKPVIENAELKQQDVLRFGIDYAITLSLWAERFSAAWPVIVENSQSFDEKFRRLWLFYLAYCEAGFRSGRIDVVQLRLGRG